MNSREPVPGTSTGTKEPPVRIKTEPADYSYCDSDSKDFQKTLNFVEQQVKLEPVPIKYEIKHEIKDEPVITYQNVTYQTNVQRPKITQLPNSGGRRYNKNRQWIKPNTTYRPSYSYNPYRLYNPTCAQNPQYLQPIVNPECSSSMTTHIQQNPRLNRNASNILNVSNLPLVWNLTQVQNFIVHECKCSPIDNIERVPDNEKNYTTVLVEFKNFRKCIQARNKLNGLVIDGIALEAKINDSDMGCDSDSDKVEPFAKRKKEDRWRPEIDMYETDPAGLYGLKPEYLRTLGIVPPLSKWVAVTNFTGPPEEIKEALQMAGRLILCHRQCRQIPKIRFLKAMFSHPLEAVQAVSMLNNKKMYQIPLKVTMIDHPDSLPIGITEVGPGLGLHGKPLNDIVKQYERYAKGRGSEIDTTIFSPLGSNVFNGFNTPSKEENQPSTSNVQNNFEYQNPLPTPRNSFPIISAPRVNETAPSLVEHNQNDPFRSGVNPCRTVSAPLAEKNCNRGNGQFQEYNQPSTSNVQTNFRPQSQPSSPQFRPATVPRLQQMAPNMFEFGQRILLGPDARGRRPMSAPLVQNTSNLHNSQSEYDNQPTSNVQNTFGSENQKPMCSGPHIRSASIPRFYQRTREFGQRAPIVPADSKLRRPMSAPLFNQGYVAIELSNLPPNTSFLYLTERMATCGPVLSLQLTTPSSAIVQFPHHSHAEKCLEIYNNTKLMGHVITVRILYL